MPTFPSFSDPLRARRVLVAVMALAAAVALALALHQAATTHAPRAASLSELVGQLQAGQVLDVTLYSDRTAEASLRNGQQVLVQLEPNAALSQTLRSYGVAPDQLSSVSFTVDDDGSVDPSQLLFGLLLVGLLGAFGLYAARRFGRPRALQPAANSHREWQVRTPGSIRFDDVAGVEEPKQELQEVVEFLKYPEKFSALGARIPKGVLLIGPPGTGKTLLSRAVAGEAGVPFFSISGSEFVEMFVGVGASRVRDLFDQAKRNAPCIVFVDEIDAVGRQRGAGLGGSHDEREQTLNQILVEMDGFDGNTNVIVIAATNRPDVLDPALLRPGRFDRQVVLPNPDINGRKAILEVHARGKPIDKTVEVATLAKVTPGFSGADLANLINEAAILAARRNKKTIGLSEMEEAIDRVIAGPERKSRVMSEREKELTAYHEAGHAVLMHFQEKHDPVHKITIVSRGMMGGYTRPLPPEDRYYMTRSQFEASIASALGGHAAETVVFGEMSTGAENDIEKATNIARKMVKEYGMSARLGPVALGHKEEMVFLGREIGEQKNYSEKVAEAIDEEIRRLIDEGYQLAIQTITAHRDVLDRLAAELIKRETLEGDNLYRILRGEPPLDDEPSRPETPQPNPPTSEEPSARERPALAPIPRLSPGAASSTSG